VRSGQTRVIHKSDKATLRTYKCKIKGKESMLKRRGINRNKFLTRQGDGKKKLAGCSRRVTFEGEITKHIASDEEKTQKN